MHRKTTFTAAALIAGASASFANADIIQQDDTGYNFVGTQSFGFDAAQAGSTVQNLDFGGLPATVSFAGRSPLSNQVFSGGDGFGAVGLDGSNFWKLRADHVRIDFGDERLTEFGFYYSDLEWSDITLNFGNVGSFVLSDSNPNENNFFSYQAGPGEVFGFVTLEWSDDTDGVGFDGFFARQVPAPGAFALLAFSGGLVLTRRRR